MDCPMQVLHLIDESRAVVRNAKRRGQRVGLVPTMGALHAGHISLVAEAKRRCGFVAVSIFVNPTQFGSGEDFQEYPRTMGQDLGVCEANGVDLVFAPGVEEMYPAGATTSIHVGTVTEGLCGPHRPGHFDGVATVVAKLFNILPADAAFFGEKDYQQLVVVRRMVHDLDIPIEIVGCPTVREPDGLAMSSRNRYLSSTERKQAAVLSAALFAAAKRVAEGERDAAKLIDGIRRAVLDAGPFRIDYVDVVDAESLQVLEKVDRPARICLAVRLGQSRLIDNVAVGGKQ